MNRIKKTTIASTSLLALDQTKEKYDFILNKPSNVPYLASLFPQEILIKIFSYFDLKDLVKLAGVCKSWHDLIHGTPQFWWNAHLKLSCKKQSKLRQNSYLFAKLYGSRCRNLVINCEHRFYYLACCKNMTVYLRKLLLLLKPTKLTSFKISDARMGCERESVRSSILQILTRMLSRFDRLQCFAMPFAKWRLIDGIKVLDAVISASKETIQSLMIDGFFHTFIVLFPQEPVNFDNVTNNILSLKKLKKLGIDYFVLTDDFVNALSTSCAQLETLRICAPYVCVATKTITQSCWVKLMRVFPTKKVEFSSINSLTEDASVSVPAVLDPVLPINKIRLNILCLDTNAIPNTGAVLQHISTHFSRSLVKFEMNIDNLDGPIDGALEIFVRNCPRLLHLKVSAHFASPHTQQRVLDLIQARRQRLIECKHLEISNKRRKLNPPDGPGSITANTES
ncbi:uncharacterized protein LOC131955708 [Physella acuta]|uniref:uncharacterized protein LOC131955708 n=1 Tax=Physella acuta TaxID=109671 RepID=UPI0027DD7D1F|nr:uncharacterized protein LOC131955708 [Physella acuta]